MTSEDRREDVRVPKRLDIVYEADTQSFPAQLSDLGEGGAFVDTSNPLPVGTILNYRFSLPGDAEPVTGKAKVVWQQPTVGMAIEFQGLSPSDHDRLRFFVASEFFGGESAG